MCVCVRMYIHAVLLAQAELVCATLQALQAEISEHEHDLDSLSDSAQDLMQVSADSRVVSQASQLATRYQTAVINSKVFQTDQILLGV